MGPNGSTGDLDNASQCVDGRGRFTDTCNRFVAFIAGSFAAVLLVASLIDPDLFLHFEITPHRTVLFYLGVFGSILAIARGMVPEENLVFDPEASLREVVRWTHYLPGEWRGKLHSQMVRSACSR